MDKPTKSFIKAILEIMIAKAEYDLKLVEFENRVNYHKEQKFALCKYKDALEEIKGVLEIL